MPGPGPPQAQVKPAGQSPGASRRQVIAPASTSLPPAPVVPPPPLPGEPADPLAPPALLPAVPCMPPSDPVVTEPHEGTTAAIAIATILRAMIRDAKRDLIPSSYARRCFLT